jgi:hypothetical protein
MLESKQADWQTEANFGAFANQPGTSASDVRYQCGRVAPEGEIRLPGPHNDPR